MAEEAPTQVPPVTTTDEVQTNAAAVATEEKPAPTRVEGQLILGTVKIWYMEKGFGFVTCEDGGADIFCHQSAVMVDGDRYRAIMPETKVQCTFYLREGKQTAKEVRSVDGTPLPGFESKLEATQKIQMHQAVARAVDGKFTGVIKFMNKDKGFGFIVPDAGGEEMFVHVGDVKGQQILQQGEPVSYTVATKKDRPQAVDVVSLRPQPAYPPYGAYPPHLYGHPPPQAGAYDMYGGAAAGAYGAPAGYPPHAYGAQDHAYGAPQDPYGAPPAAGGVESGTIKWFNEGKDFGFIIPNNGTREVYFKGQDLQGGGTIGEGEPVTYETKTSPDGKSWAVMVVRAPGGAPAGAGAKRKAPPSEAIDPYRRPQQPGYGQPPPPQAGAAGAYGAGQQGGYGQQQGGAASAYGQSQPGAAAPPSYGAYSTQSQTQQYGAPATGGAYGGAEAGAGAYGSQYGQQQAGASQQQYGAPAGGNQQYGNPPAASSYGDYYPQQR